MVHLLPWEDAAQVYEWVSSALCTPAFPWPSENLITLDEDGCSCSLGHMLEVRSEPKFLIAQTKVLLEPQLSMPTPEKALSNQALDLPEVLMKLFLGKSTGQSAVYT